jgi:hypothetical protein
MAINEFKWTPEEIKVAQQTYYTEAREIHDEGFGVFSWNSEAVTAALNAVKKDLYRVPRLTAEQEQTVKRLCQDASDEELKLIEIIRATTEPCPTVDDFLAEIMPYISLKHREFVEKKLKEAVQLAKESKL